MKKVVVEFKDKGYSPIPSYEMTEIGVLFDNGQVLVADDLGAVSIHNCMVDPQKPDWVIVDRINDDKDYSEEDPEYIVNLIISGGAAK